MDVIINGEQYIPAKRAGGSGIGIAITTHNRPAELAKALCLHLKHLPAGAFIVVVDDGSEIPAVVPDGVELIRHEQSKGIVASKNASLKALMDLDCMHLFLWDDDAYPIADNWHEPYIASGEAHLSYQFLDLSGNRKLNDIAVLHKDREHVAYTGQRGVMLYYKRKAIETVGGFDWIYGRGMYEHSDLATRIYHAGLNSWAFADVVGSENLIHSMDEHVQVNRSVPTASREALVKANVKIHNARRDIDYAAYVPLEEPVNVVLTTLLTSAIDPQRGKAMDASPDILSVWSKSIRGASAIVLADVLAVAPPGASIEPVDAAEGNPYFLRWLHIYRWLRANDDVGFVFATDGTDVEMLREPWGDMRAGTLYVGSEPKLVGDSWMFNSHEASHLQAFMAKNKAKTLLNAGVVGGDRRTVMAFAHDMVKDYYRTASRRFWKAEGAGREVGDMATFNYIAYMKWADKIVTGPQVHTVFKTEGFGKECAWWRHK